MRFLLDERRVEFVGGFQQQLPDSAPGEVVAPPAGGEFGFDVSEAGGLDLGPEGGEADRLANDLQIALGETDTRPAGRSDCVWRSIGENGLTSGSSRGATLPALVQQVATSAGAFMR